MRDLYFVHLFWPPRHLLADEVARMKTALKKKNHQCHNHATIIFRHGFEMRKNQRGTFRAATWLGAHTPSNNTPFGERATNAVEGVLEVDLADRIAVPQEGRDLAGAIRQACLSQWRRIGGVRSPSKRRSLPYLTKRKNGKLPREEKLRNNTRD